VHNRNSRAFISLCLQPHDLRPTADQLLEHDFLKENEAEDFKFVRGKLGGGGLGDLREEDPEGSDEGGADAGPPGDAPRAEDSPVKSLGSDAAAKILKSARVTMSLGSVPLSGEAAGDSEAGRERSSLAVAGSFQDEDPEKLQKSDASPLTRNASTDKLRQRDPPSPVKPTQAADDASDRSRDGSDVSGKEAAADGGFTSGRSRGGSGGRSRILRVQMRSGSASGPDLRRSPSHSQGIVTIDDVLEQAPIARTNSEPADMPSLAGNARQVCEMHLPAAVSEGRAAGMAAPAAPSSDELRAYDDAERDGLSRCFLSSATIFDLLDIDPTGETIEKGGGAGRSNEALIIMMAVPSAASDEDDSYQEVQFEFNVLLDEPSVVVDEMQSDPELADTIKPFATNMVTVLSAVCDVARRVAMERISTGNFSCLLSIAVLREILRMHSDEDPYSQYVDCSDAGAGDAAAEPLTALCAVARVRLANGPAAGDWAGGGGGGWAGGGGVPPKHVAWSLSGQEDDSNQDFGTVTDAEADRILFEDPRYLDALAAYQENLLR
jgi:hypothetical protein